MNRYGGFSGDGMEFIITRPDTPTPWVNYISNGRYHGIVSNTGGGYSFYRTARDGRITRWRYNSLPVDRPGRYLYLREKDTGHYWSPTWQPTATPLDRYQCRHGVYYTAISSLYRQIEASILYFVPEDDDLEVWRITVENQGALPKQLDLFSYVELCLGHALIDLINRPNDQHFNEVVCDRERQILLAGKRYWAPLGVTLKQTNQSWDRYVFFASSLPLISWDGSRDAFIGRWRSEQNPIAVELGRCSNTEITAGDAVAGLHMDITLDPGARRELTILLGVVPREDFKATSAALVEKYRNPEVAENAYLKLRTNWRDYLSAVQVETPEPDMNTMLNVWNQYQTSVTFFFSRDASYYHGGLLFGRGYRDSCQDLLGPVIARPQWVRERIFEMSTYQFAGGGTYHLYYPESGGGEVTGHSDTQLWLPLAALAYLKETGDFAALDTVIRYNDHGQAALLDHLFAAIDFTLRNLSERRLVKFGRGDWNEALDYMGRSGKGESVWVTMFLCYILRETAELCEHLGRRDRAEFYRTHCREIAIAVNELCWDGRWYIRGTNDLGQVIGSHHNREGQIFLNTQSWAVISGVAGSDRAVSCMDAVIELLDTTKGPQILAPPYRTIDPNIGLTTRCVPGKKENGAVFNHTVSWAILAECLLGRGDRAFDIYRKALPMNPVIDIDRYEVEPYVYAEYVTSPDHPTVGQASHSWLTGSAAWMLRDALDYILGVRPTLAGLMIDPCIPSGWSEYRVTRNFRGSRICLHVKNPHQHNRGVSHLTVNGREVTGNLIAAGAGILTAGDNIIEAEIV